VSAVNAVNPTNAVNAVNATKAVNAVNMVGALNAVNALNAIQAVRAISASNQVNSVMAISAVNALNALSSSLPEGMRVADQVVASAHTIPEGGDLSQLTPRQIDDQCPPMSLTTFQTSSRYSDGAWLTYTFPKFQTLGNIFEALVYPEVGNPFYDPNQTGNPGEPVIVNIDRGDGSNAPHQVYLGFALACSNLVVRPLILQRLTFGLAASSTPPTSFDDSTDYMCLRWADPADLQSKWFCGAGNLADGVTGIVVINSTSPRTFMLNKLTWGPNTWDHHWEWASSLGPIQKRIPAAEQNGFAQAAAWNLNPRRGDAQDEYQPQRRVHQPVHHPKRAEQSLQSEPTADAAFREHQLPHRSLQRWNDECCGRFRFRSPGDRPSAAKHRRAEPRRGRDAGLRPR
jgi:hypothetical protein